MKNTIITLIFTIIYSLIEHGHAQSNKCGIEKFQCKDGQCIASELLCDGRAHCKDKSDETFEECQKPEITCPDYTFRCAYGACVDGDATCNGIRDCIDNSDETLARCSGVSHNVSTPCAKNQFKCNNGQCISESDLCDGTVDCTDKSDESFIHCGSVTCPQFFFHCKYGACIDGDLKCDGVTNCADGSDEDPSLCGRITPTPPERPIYPPVTRPPIPETSTSSSKSCVVPPQPEHGHWKLHKSQCCTGRNAQSCDHCDVNQGARLEPGAYLVYSCNFGYKLSDLSNVVCSRQGEWLNIPNCIEIRCEHLKSTSIIATCSYNSGKVPCDVPVLPNTTASLQCSNSYREDTSVPSRRLIKCNVNGQWDSNPMRCIPECGVPYQHYKPLIINGIRPNISDFPWHATLYRVENPTAPKEFICGATIVHEKFLITAAHCVFNENNSRKDNASHFYIATGNIYRDYDSPFNKEVTKAAIINIHIPSQYYGANGNFAEDIAILEIEQPFTLSSKLIPICLDVYDDIIPLEQKVLGKVAGFGRTALGSFSYILQTITVPYIPFNECKSITAALENRRFITGDKFCAGYTNGTSVCNGDSGGGLVFQSDGRWYLKGIVSVSLNTVEQGGDTMCDSYSYSLYTKVSKHMSWIREKLTERQYRNF